MLLFKSLCTRIFFVSLHVTDGIVLGCSKWHMLVALHHVLLHSQLLQRYMGVVSTLGICVHICQTCNNAGLRVISITCSLLIRPRPTARPRPRCLIRLNNSCNTDLVFQPAVVLKAAITLEHHRCSYFFTDI